MRWDYMRMLSYDLVLTVLDAMIVHYTLIKPEFYLMVRQNIILGVGDTMRICLS